MKNHSDVGIIGCGPAGAVAGALLAARGYSVAIFDRDRHPRHHIGESLLPASMGILESIGMSAAWMQAHHQPKFGARFFDPVVNRMETFSFASRDAGAVPPAFNVLREEFDQQLCDLAQRKGCAMYANCNITAVTEDTAPVRINTATGDAHSCDFLIDASGGAAMLAKKLGHRDMIPDFGRLAVYNYFADFPFADLTDPLERQYFTMHLIDDGWIWLIPLHNGSISIGAVLKREAVRKNMNPREQFGAAVAQSPLLQERLRNARALSEYRVAGDYSYHCGQRFGSHYVLIGDAAGFLDPIFSSGVHLAVSSAARVVEAVEAVLQHGNHAALAVYQTEMEAGTGVFQAFVGRFYQRDLVRNLFFAANQNVMLRKAIIDILAGHVWDRSNPLIPSLHRNAAEANAVEAAIADKLVDEYRAAIRTDSAAAPLVREA